MITWSQTLEEGTIQLEVNSQPQWMEYIQSAVHTARWISTTAHLVTQTKKGSEFWTLNYGSAAYIHGYYTFLSGYKISD